MLNKIRQKPDHVKHSLAIAITTVIFSCIVFVWWSSRDARSSSVFVREKTVSPLDGFTSMFDGFVSGIKDRLSNEVAPSEQSVSTSTEDESFDLSGVLIIDSSIATSTEEN